MMCRSHGKVWGQAGVVAVACGRADGGCADRHINSERDEVVWKQVG